MRYSAYRSGELKGDAGLTEGEGVPRPEVASRGLNQYFSRANHRGIRLKTEIMLAILKVLLYTNSGTVNVQA